MTGRDPGTNPNNAKRSPKRLHGEKLDTTKRLDGNPITKAPKHPMVGYLGEATRRLQARQDDHDRTLPSLRAKGLSESAVHRPGSMQKRG